MAASASCRMPLTSKFGIPGLGMVSTPPVNPSARRTPTSVIHVTTMSWSPLRTCDAVARTTWSRVTCTGVPLSAIKGTFHSREYRCHELLDLFIGDDTQGSCGAQRRQSLTNLDQEVDVEWHVRVGLAEPGIRLLI